MNNQSVERVEENTIPAKLTHGGRLYRTGRFSIFLEKSHFKTESFPSETRGVFKKQLKKSVEIYNDLIAEIDNLNEQVLRLEASEVVLKEKLDDKDELESIICISVVKKIQELQLRIASTEFENRSLKKIVRDFAKPNSKNSRHSKRKYPETKLEIPEGKKLASDEEIESTK